MQVRLTRRLLAARGDPARLTAAERDARAAYPVALVSMPWTWPHPQLPLGLLTAIGRSHGFPVDPHHLGLELASVLPLDAHVAVQDHGQGGLGEWLFGVAAFDSGPDPAGGYLAGIRAEDRTRLETAGLSLGRLRELRDHVLPAWVDRLAAAVDWGGYRLVGFTSSFAQNAATFALARRIKSRWPDVVIAVGGPNMERPMGEAWLRGIPALDLVASGDGDQVFPTLLAVLAGGGDPSAVPGVLARRPDGAIADGGTAPPFEDLDTLPVPDYHEFYERLDRLGLDRSALPYPTVQFEASRGCWWGERRHCTFCGLNGASMAYRAKSVATVVAELDELARRHGIRRFRAADNILAREHATGLLDDLAARGGPYRLFFEVKSNLGRAELRRCRAAGLDTIQPGIESLNSRVLGLMRKGVRASTNVNLLRWAGHFDVAVVWNLLWGFPGERQVDVDEQVALLGDVVHLRPPQGRGRLRIDRFSPLHDDRDSLPIHDLRPADHYLATFPPTIDLLQAAYEFDGHITGALPDEAYERLEAAYLAWVGRWAVPPAPILTVAFHRDAAVVHDTRDGTERLLVLDPAAAAAYEACFDRPTKEATVLAAAAAATGEREARQSLDRLVADRLVMRDGGLLLALAVPALHARRHGTIPPPRHAALR